MPILKHVQHLQFFKTLFKKSLYKSIKTNHKHTTSQNYLAAAPSVETVAYQGHRTQVAEASNSGADVPQEAVVAGNSPGTLLPAAASARAEAENFQQPHLATAAASSWGVVEDPGLATSAA